MYKGILNYYKNISHNLWLIFSLLIPNFLIITFTFEKINDCKLYLCVLSSFIYFTIMIRSKFIIININNNIKFHFFLICLLNSIYVILQKIKILPSLNPYFDVTGSFDNPMIVSFIISSSFPFYLFFLKKINFISAFALVIPVVAVFLSGSRLGIFSILVCLYFYIKRKVGTKIHFSVYIIIAIILFFYKFDSSCGRVYIFLITYNLIKERLFFGYGVDGFTKEFMLSQAEYFKENYNSLYMELADNIMHPFNEFLKISIEFGLVGLLILLLIVFIVFKKIISTPSKNDYLPTFLVFLIYSFFTYPFHYYITFIILFFFLILVLDIKKIKLKTRTKLLFITLFILFIFFMSKKLYYSYKWENVNSNNSFFSGYNTLNKYDELMNTELNKNTYFLYNYSSILNSFGLYKKSNDILNKVELILIDYDVILLRADNYYNLNNYKKAIEYYSIAHNMIPNRFLPLYGSFNVYKKTNPQRAKIIANLILSKNIKVNSALIAEIIEEAKEYILKT